MQAALSPRTEAKRKRKKKKKQKTTFPDAPPLDLSWLWQQAWDPRGHHYYFRLATEVRGAPGFEKTNLYTCPTIQIKIDQGVSWMQGPLWSVCSRLNVFKSLTSGSMCADAEACQHQLA